MSNDDLSPSDNICIVTKNFAAFFPTQIFSDFYNDKDRFDWDLKPSSPCKKLVAALAAFEPVIHAHIYDFYNVKDDIAFATMIMQLRKRQIYISSDKKTINQYKTCAARRIFKQMGLSSTRNKKISANV